MQHQSANTKRDLLLFAGVWALLMVLYWPARQAGFVWDFTGWLEQVKYESFADYLNRTHATERSFYQFTHLTTYLFYLLFGTYAPFWHLLHVTLQAINVVLLFCLCNRLFGDAGIKGGTVIALGGCLLFCVNPHLAEVIVWEPSYHFLQGVILILLILLQAQQYIHQPKAKHAVIAGLLFLCSAFALEIFYLTPLFVLSLAYFYRKGLNYDKAAYRKVLYYFVLPQVVVIALHVPAVKLVFNNWVAHVGTETLNQSLAGYLVKIPKYLFHILFMGRFFPDETKSKVYGFISEVKFLWAFYGLLLLTALYIVSRFGQMQAKSKVAALLLFWTVISFAIFTPLWFEEMKLSGYDRYTYLPAAFLYMLLCVGIAYLSVRVMFSVLIGTYALVNVYFTRKLVLYWNHSAAVINNLIDTVPLRNDKIILFLNVPHNLNGVAMIGTAPGSEVKLMHNLLRGTPMMAEAHDVAAFNMLTPTDGAHVTVMNDSMVRVTLNQWGTWWWYGAFGLSNYENDSYKVNVTDPGHVYELTLKLPADKYLLLYTIGKDWRIVDWNKKNEDLY